MNILFASIQIPLLVSGLTGGVVGLILGRLLPIPRRWSRMTRTANAAAEDPKMAEYRKLAHEAALKEFPGLVRR